MQGIGFLARLITELEANPLPAVLTRNGTYFKTIQCQAAYDPATPEHIRALVAKASHDDDALEKLQAELTRADYAATAGSDDRPPSRTTSSVILALTMDMSI